MFKWFFSEDATYEAKVHSASCSDFSTYTTSTACATESSGASSDSSDSDDMLLVRVLSVSGDELYTMTTESMYMTVRSLQYALQFCLGIPLVRQKLLAQNQLVGRDVFLHKLTDGEVLDLTLIQSDLIPVDFNFITSHRDIKILDRGASVAVPAGSYHGGVPVVGDCVLTSGCYFWRLCVQRCNHPCPHRNFKAGVVPHDWNDGDSRDRIVWMPHEASDVNMNSTAQQGTVVEIELDLYENVMKWSLSETSETINGESDGIVQLPPGLSWKPIVKLSHRVHVSQVHIDE